MKGKKKMFFVLSEHPQTQTLDSSPVDWNTHRSVSFLKIKLSIFFLARPSVKRENAVNVNELFNISEYRVDIYHHKSRQKLWAEMLKISR